MAGSGSYENISKIKVENFITNTDRYLTFIICKQSMEKTPLCTTKLRAKNTFFKDKRGGGRARGEGTMGKNDEQKNGSSIIKRYNFLRQLLRFQRGNLIDLSAFLELIKWQLMMLKVDFTKETLFEV